MKLAFRVLLASGSPRRREILAQLGVPFVVVPQDATELASGASPRRVAFENARRKARAAAVPATVATSRGSLKDVVVGVDTIVVLGGCVLGKPRDARESRGMIEALSGHTHEVISAIHLALGRGGRAVTLAASTAVTFRRLTAREILWYVETGEGRDKAGGYGIQGLGALLVEGIHGDYFNVVGFPVQAFRRGLARLGLHFPVR